jgi:hypothetical protein
MKNELLGTLLSQNVLKIDLACVLGDLCRLAVTHGDTLLNH